MKTIRTTDDVTDKYGELSAPKNACISVLHFIKLMYLQREQLLDQSDNGASGGCL